MKFRITGADRRTGREVKRDYEANTEEAAIALANMDGLMVADTELVPYDDGDGEVASGRVARQPVAYRSPTTHSGSVPTYGGLGIASSVLLVYAILCYVLGGIAFLMGLFTVVMGAAGGTRESGFVVFIGFMSGLGPALVLLFAAAISHGLSAACVALRDIARNSWR